MPRGIDEIELIGLTIARLIIQGYRLCLDGNPAFAFQVHRIQHLLRHLTFGQAATDLDEAVGNGRFTVIDMGDNGEVADILHADNLRRAKSLGILRETAAKRQQ